jgi:uronate dehydrogenase
MNEQSKKRILVTGSAGAIGWAVCRALAQAGYTVRGFDRAPTPEDRLTAEAHVGELADADAVRRAVAGCDAVIHLAAVPNSNAPLPGAMCDANILGQYHVMEACREHAIHRVVITSTVMVAWAHPWRERVIRFDEGVKPDTHYALTKLYAEQMGEMYSRLYGMSVVAIRPAWYIQGPFNPSRMTPSAQSNYLSTADAGKAYRLAIEADDARIGGFAAVYITSKQVGNNGFDLEPARRVLGYEPDDTFPQNLYPKAIPTDK